MHIRRDRVVAKKTPLRRMRDSRRLKRAAARVMCLRFHDDECGRDYQTIGRFLSRTKQADNGNDVANLDHLESKVVGHLVLPARRETLTRLPGGVCLQDCLGDLDMSVAVSYPYGETRKNPGENQCVATEMFQTARSMEVLGKEPYPIKSPENGRRHADRGGVVQRVAHGQTRLQLAVQL